MHTHPYLSLSLPFFESRKMLSSSRCMNFEAIPDKQASEPPSYVLKQAEGILRGKEKKALFHSLIRLKSSENILVNVMYCTVHTT